MISLPWDCPDKQEEKRKGTISENNFQKILSPITTKP